MLHGQVCTAIVWRFARPFRRVPKILDTCGCTSLPAADGDNNNINLIDEAVIIHNNMSRSEENAGMLRKYKLVFLGEQSGTNLEPTFLVLNLCSGA